MDGRVQITVGAGNVLALTCAPTGLCAGNVEVPVHSNGVGQTYTSCAPLGTPGDASTYTLEMAQRASAAWLGATQVQLGTANPCGAGSAWFVSRGVGTASEEHVVWMYTGPAAGHVRATTTVTTASALCPDTSDPTWN